MLSIRIAAALWTNKVWFWQPQKKRFLPKNAIELRAGIGLRDTIFLAEVRIVDMIGLKH